jgi:hypothetical protein
VDRLRIEEVTGLSSTTISRLLTRLKLSRRSSIKLKPPQNSYQHATPAICCT